MKEEIIEYHTVEEWEKLGFKIMKGQERPLYTNELGMEVYSNHQIVNLYQKIDEFKGEHRFLSNFYPCEIKYEGISYPTTEHAYQAAKTDDVSIKIIMSTLRTASDAKKAGYGIDILPDFEHNKIDIMKKILILKFSQKDFRTKLLHTGNTPLKEGNTWHDNFWGSCFCCKCSNKGKNVLGKLLMEVRNEIREKK